MEDSSLHVFLADFGLAHIISSAGTCSKSTAKCGTPGFQAPEQLKAGVVTCKADIYSFGCVMVELFGCRPLWGSLEPCTK